ncbi:sulfotransferase family 2 domain-containing protein [Sediminitomix flava]|uniref:Sulfotransferase family protein n=1 Tax=Sediminitomix flava TaxID=379075 RepID=A0A315ZEQ2_SEDFL|nr:sulfotransferase family 2 domain-containing protein [Sediminitomix flava]PWJ43308.1 sulfotransferase family protein [Sediminitomix flava]
MEYTIPKELFTKRDIDLTFMHIHNPKSAGSMFRNILKRNFKDNFGDDLPYVSYKKYDKEDIRSLLYLYPFECFTSHNYSLLSLPFDELNIIGISFVRNPIEKLLSSYFYLKNRSMTSDWHILRNKSLDEVIDFLCANRNFHPFLLDTGQADWILGQETQTIDPFKDYLNNGSFHLFPTERFDEVCVILETLYPTKFKDCSYTKRVNTSEKDLVISEDTLSKINKLPWLRVDNALYEMSNNYLSDLQQKIFSPNEFSTKLEDFRNRCAAQNKDSKDKRGHFNSILRKFLSNKLLTK